MNELLVVSFWDLAKRYPGTLQPSWESSGGGELLLENPLTYNL